MVTLRWGRSPDHNNSDSKSDLTFAILRFFSTQNLKVPLRKTFAWGMRNTLFFWQMRGELWDFVTQEAQSVSAHWCSELAGLSLWNPINSALCLLPPLPHHTACSYMQPTAAPGNTCLSLTADLGWANSTVPVCCHFLSAVFNPAVNFNNWYINVCY